MTLRAFVSRRVVTPEGVRPAAILVEGERVREVVRPEEIPAQADSRLRFCRDLWIHMSILMIRAGPIGKGSRRRVERRQRVATRCLSICH